MDAVLDRSDVRRQAIVSAAVALADSDSLAAVTMRSVAARLGVGTMTLYSYVSSKDDLFELMVDEVNREMLVPEPLPSHWRDALRAIALRTRDAIERHPWIFALRAQRRQPREGVNMRRHVEQSRAAVASLGLEGPTAWAILAAVDDYTLGYSVRRQAQRRIARQARGPEGGGAGRPAPVLRGPRASNFELGLEWLLDGIEAALA